MRGFEQLPVTQANGNFPMADVNDPNLVAMADDWFDTVGTYPHERLENYIEYTSQPKDGHGDMGKKTHQAALKLIDEWEYYHDGNLNQHIAWGYRLARSFQDETHFLPPFTADFAEQLKEMGNSDRTAKGNLILGCVEKAEFFGRSAWLTMEHSHPQVFKQFNRLIEVARIPFSLNTDDGERYFIIGMMLPYMFSYVSQMENYISEHGYTGFDIESTGE